MVVVVIIIDDIFVVACGGPEHLGRHVVLIKDGGALLVPQQDKVARLFAVLRLTEAVLELIGDALRHRYSTERGHRGCQIDSILFCRDSYSLSQRLGVVNRSCDEVVIFGAIDLLSALVGQLHHALTIGEVRLDRFLVHRDLLMVRVCLQLLDVVIGLD